MKLSYRRMYAVIVGTLVLNFMLFKNHRLLDRAFMFLTAWLWAAYIDDTLVMSQHVYVPDYWVPRFAMI